MTKKELLKKLSDLEWEDFEVKAAKSTIPKDVWETVSSFSNSFGGWIILGIQQKGKDFLIEGVNNAEKLEQDFLATLRGGQKFNIPILPNCKFYKIGDKKVLGFYIPPSSKKPVYYNNQANTFIRKGSGDLRASSEEIDAMFRDQSFGVKTSEAVKNTSVTNLKSKSIREYRDYMSRFNPTVGYNQKELDDFLTSMRVIDSSSKECTVAGLLFFGQRNQIEKFFPDFRIDLLEIPGTNYGDSLSRYTFRLTEDDYENLWEAYFECFKRIRKVVDIQFQLSNEGFGEELSTGLKAVREALVNMLMHADYYAQSCPRVRIFSNRIEFYNPGGLPKLLSELKEKDLSIPRNPILAKLFRMVKLAENAGFGFDKMEQNWKDYNQTTPEYDMSFDSVIVSMQLKTNTTKDADVHSSIDWKKGFENITELLNSTPEFNLDRLRGIYGVFTGYLRGIYGVNDKIINESLSEREGNVLLLIALFPSITRQEMAKIVGVSISTIEKSLQRIRKLKLITRVGADKTGIWKIVKQKE
ncbi:MAG: putative DNA binding domain-containing protein [Brumimicrobium sp.]|nr:putative DNA binding domain-containing protein [Brumimicrobium sp.]